MILFLLISATIFFINANIFFISSCQHSHEVPYRFTTGAPNFRHPPRQISGKNIFDKNDETKNVELVDILWCYVALVQVQGTDGVGMFMYVCACMCC